VVAIRRKKWRQKAINEKEEIMANDSYINCVRKAYPAKVSVVALNDTSFSFLFSFFFFFFFFFFYFVVLLDGKLKRAIEAGPYPG
jgi:hypothetical protein